MINFSKYIKRLDSLNFAKINSIPKNNILPFDLNLYKLKQLTNVSKDFGKQLAKQINKNNNIQTQQPAPLVNSEEVSKLSIQNQYNILRDLTKKDERKPNYTQLLKRKESEQENSKGKQSSNKDADDKSEDKK